MHLCMPTAPIPAGFFKANINFNSRGPSGVRSVGIAAKYAQTGPSPVFGTPSWFEEMAQYTLSMFTVHMAALTASTTEVTSIALETPAGGAVMPVAAGNVGGDGSPLAPPQEAVILQFRGSVPGRWGRGRMFLPDTIEAAFDSSGIIDPTIAASYTTMAENIRDHWDATTSTWDVSQGLLGMHILHRMTTGPSAGQPPTRVFFGTVNPQPGWLRRRGR